MREEVGPDLLDDRTMMILRLVHNRRMGRASAWRAYIRLLPGEEIVRALPMHWDDDVLQERLGGTALVEKVREQKLQLRRLHERVLRDGLCARWPELFPPSDFSWAALCWGHAIFWSRAICVPLGGGHEECLTPLLDLCNHAPGATHELRYVSGGGGSCALHAGRSVREGEELLINYGAKSNGELLRCHGFVLRDNQVSAHGPTGLLGPSAPTRPAPPAAAHQADVLELCLPEILDAAGVEPHAHQSHLADLAAVGVRRRLHLFRHELPPELLPIARYLCAETHSDRSAARDALDKSRAAPTTEDGGGAFDWSEVDWEADDPFAACRPPESSPLSPEGEARTLAVLTRMLEARAEQLPRDRPPGSSSDEKTMREVAPLGSAEACDEAAAVYCSGQRALLEEALCALRGIAGSAPSRRVRPCRRGDAGE